MMIAAVPVRITGSRLNATIRLIPSTAPGITKGNMIKRSMTSDIYDEEKVIRILKVEIAEVERYISRFCTTKEYPEIAGKVIYEQFEKFLEDIEIESGKWKEIYHDYLFTRTCSNVAKALEDLGLRDQAESVREQGKELSK